MKLLNQEKSALGSQNQRCGHMQSAAASTRHQI